MDVLPLVVHGNHPQNNTDEEQQHCNGVTSSVHEQPVAKQSELITQSVSWHGSVTFRFERKRRDQGSSTSNVASIMGCRAALSCACQRAQQVPDKQQLQQHIHHHPWECSVDFERRCFVMQRNWSASDSKCLCLCGEGNTVVTGVGSGRSWTFQSHQQ